MSDDPAKERSRWSRQHDFETLDYRLGMIQGTLDSLVTHLVRIEKQHDELRGRITDLEKWKARVLGVASALAVLVSAVVSVLADHLKSLS